ncbi:MAG: phosphotransferase enzyme family protein [Stackebrandtia sp.]
MPQREQPLSGGNVAETVVRVGETVRKPATVATPSVDAALRHLEAAGFDGAPRSFGVDERQRHVLEFIPGTMADAMPPMTEAELHRVGGVIRRLHDLLADFTPPTDARWEVPIAPDRADLICHHDLAPWNLVRDGDLWVFIDWDGAGPGSRLWDLAYAAHGFVGFHATGDPAAEATRLRALADGYRLSRVQGQDMAAMLAARVRSMYDLLADGARTGRQPWARLFAEGHGDHWGPTADYLRRHQRVWSRALA